MSNSIYQLGILVGGVVTSAVITRTLTKKEDEEKFLQFKQNMEELKKENSKLKSKCCNDEEEIEDLEKELTSVNEKYSNSLEERQKLVDFIDNYQTASIDIFTNMSKPVANIINKDYLEAAEDCINASDDKSLIKSMKRLSKIDLVVEKPIKIEVDVPEEHVDSFLQDQIHLNIDDSDFDDDEDEDDEENSAIIERMSLNDIMTPEVYQDICNRIEELDDDEDAFSYKSILDNILEYIFIKRTIVNKSTHYNEINDLNYISKLDVDKETLEKIEEFYDNMKFCIININDVYQIFEKYYRLRDNKFLNRTNFFNNKTPMLIPVILYNIDSISDNDIRIKTIMSLSNILRKMEDIINDDSDNNRNDDFYKLLQDIILISQHNLSDDKIEKYVASEFEAIDEYNNMVEEYLENITNDSEE